MAVGDVYELVHEMHAGSKTMINRYHYRNVGVSGDADDLAQGFATDVLPAIQDFQSTVIQYDRLIVVNYDDLTDYTELDLTGNGGQSTATGDNLPFFVAGKIQLLRTSRAIRHGAKRYVGLRESDVVDNNLTTAARTRLDAIATALQANVTGPAGGTFELVLYGDVTPNRPSPIVIPVGGVQAFDRTTSQVSRKLS